MQTPEPQSFDRVLSSMCTEPHPAAREAAERFLATNPGDPATYEAVAGLEERAVELLATVTDHPTPTDAAGYVTGGGTEANLQRCDQRGTAIPRATSTSSPPRARTSPFIRPRACSTSISGRSRSTTTTGRTWPPSRPPSTTRPRSWSASRGRRSTAGWTRYPNLGRIAREAGAFLHVDAAWGGFILPFTDHEWSFADAPVDTLTIDPISAGEGSFPRAG